MVQVNDTLIKEDPEMIQKFTNAVVRGMIWHKNNASKDIAARAAPLFSGVSPEVFADTVAHTLQALSMNGYFSQEGHQAAEKFALDVEFITQPLSRDKVVDDSFCQ